MTPHLLQSETWEIFQKALGAKTLRISTPHTQCLGIIERPHGTVGKLFKRLYVPYGPAIGRDADLEAALVSVEAVAKKESCDIVRVEPYGQSVPEKTLLTMGYTARHKSTQPTVTSIVSLRGSEEEIVARMNATNRNLWRKNVSLGKEGVLFRTEWNVTASQGFLDMMHQTSARSGAIFHTDDYFMRLIDSLGTEKKAGLMYASVGGKDVACTLFVIDTEGSTLYYLHAGSTDAARTFNAGNVLVSNLILYAKSLGLQYVDLFGVAPSDATEQHPLYGISRFKRAYGGVDVMFAGTWEKSLSPAHKIMKRAHALMKRGT